MNRLDRSIFGTNIDFRVQAIARLQHPFSYFSCFWQGPVRQLRLLTFSSFSTQWRVMVGSWSIPILLPARLDSTGPGRFPSSFSATLPECYNSGFATAVALNKLSRQVPGFNADAKS